MKTKYKPGDVLERWDGKLIVIEKLLFTWTYKAFVINIQGIIIYYGSYTESELDMFAAKKIEI